MTTEVTAGIKVTVLTTYESDLSNPASKHFIFSYRVEIENQNSFEVQLLRRHWLISDSLNDIREIEGEGVVGQSPILRPGEIYQYESACNLKSDLGSMRGTYLFQRIEDGQLFKVNIPEFKLESPERLN